MIIGVTSFVPTINVVSENVNEIVHSFIHAITDVKLFNPSQILPGYDIVTCLEDPKTPFRLFNNMLIGVARDPRKPPITKISVSAVDQSIKCSTQEYFRMGKPIYEIYGKREDSWPALKLYHCENVQEAVKYGKIAIIKLNQSGFLLACLEPIYTMGLQSDIQVENSVINPSCDIIPDIKTFIFPQVTELTKYIVNPLYSRSSRAQRSEDTFLGESRFLEMFSLMQREIGTMPATFTITKSCRIASMPNLPFQLYQTLRLPITTFFSQCC
jgi:hypothetical protein